MLTEEQAPTRSAMQQLRAEHDVTREAYAFIDEKRLLLAAELLRNVVDYEALSAEYRRAFVKAQQALKGAVRRHGLQGIQVYPVRYLHDSNLQCRKRNFMGVLLQQCQLEIPDESSSTQPGYLTPESEQCRHDFLELTLLAARLAGVSGNLYRLLAEYKRTERRVRALENIIIPELTAKLRDMSTRLDELDQEDIIRIHRNRHRC